MFQDMFELFSGKQSWICWHSPGWPSAVPQARGPHSGEPCLGTVVSPLGSRPCTSPLSHPPIATCRPESASQSTRGLFGLPCKSACIYSEQIQWAGWLGVCSGNDSAPWPPPMSCFPLPAPCCCENRRTGMLLFYSSFCRSHCCWGSYTFFHLLWMWG